MNGLWSRFLLKNSLKRHFRNKVQFVPYMQKQMTQLSCLRFASFNKLIKAKKLNHFFAANDLPYPDKTEAYEYKTLP